MWARNDLSWSFDGSDLVFSFANSPNDRVTITDYTNNIYKIESIVVEGNVLTNQEIIDGASV